jgi:hypothetical protein
MENEMPPLRNDDLKKAIKKIHEEYNQENETNFLEELKNASFLAPADIQIEGDLKEQIEKDGTVTLDQNTPMNFMLISAEDGKNFFPAFTDEEELAKDQVKQNAIILKLENYLDMLSKNTEDIQGIAINPFGEAIVIPREMLFNVFGQ